MSDTEVRDLKFFFLTTSVPDDQIRLYYVAALGGRSRRAD